MTYQKFNFLFDIYEMGRYALETKLGNIENLLYFQSGESSTRVFVQ